MNDNNELYQQSTHNPLMIVISGPSGSGKDSVLTRMKERELPFHFVVTATTRKPRQNEIDGVDYFFISLTEFTNMIENEELLEYALVYKDYKGIPKEQVRQALASGKNVVMRIDVQGAATIRQISPQAVFIFLTTQDEDEMVARLKKRKTETSDGLNTRIETARQEMKRINEFDYVVINKDCHLDEAVDTILSIIHAERHRAVPREVTL